MTFRLRDRIEVSNDTRTYTLETLYAFIEELKAIEEESFPGFALWRETIMKERHYASKSLAFWIDYFDYELEIVDNPEEV
jgi:hypothetical protein